MSDTLRLGMPLVAPGQAQKHVPVNESLCLLDALVHLAVLDASLTAPPPAPADGDRYIVAAEPDGDWAGHGGEVAVWRDGGWLFHAPQSGWLAWDASRALLLAYDDGDWSAACGALPALGIGTSADALNPLSVRGDNVLFAARAVVDGGGDMRVKINREAAERTASLLFQSGWSGRAEFGLIGDSDVALKVSQDGALWREALRVDAETATLSCPAQGAATPFSHGACWLALDGTVLGLRPDNGGGLQIDGRLRSVPAAGVTLAATGFAADTTFFIYASWSGDAMALAASTAAPVADGATGVMVSSASAAHTLVGMARTVTGPAWVDSPGQRFVRSWFGRRGVVATGALAGDVTLAAGPSATIDAAVSLDVLAWAGEALMLSMSGSCVAAGTTQAQCALVADDVVRARQVASLAAAAVWSPALAAHLTAGSHGLIALHCASGASTAALTWAGADAALAARLRITASVGG